MLKLIYVRPNTVGETFSKEFDDYSSAESFIEAKCEKLADSGWDISELSGSNSFKGCIECTHDDVADVLLIKWFTVCEEEDCECNE